MSEMIAKKIDISLDSLSSSEWELSLYDLFYIPRDPSFSSRVIDELGLSVRSYNCLKNNDCITLDSLFLKTLLQIKGFYALGKKSLVEIINKCKDVANDYLSGEKKESQLAKSSHLKTVNENEKLLFITESIAAEHSYDIEELDYIEKSIVQMLENVDQVLGNKLNSIDISKLDVMRDLSSLINNYIEWKIILKQIDAISSCLIEKQIPTTLHILPFVCALKKKTIIDLKSVFAETDCFIDLSRGVNKYLLQFPQNQTDLIDSLQVFVDEISIGVEVCLEKAYKNTLFTERGPLVIRMRQEGLTLAEVGEALNITRERVRQIESKTVRRFSTIAKQSRIDVIFFIHALLDGELMIHKKEIAKIILDKDILDLLWASVEDGAFDCDLYHYSKRFSAIVFKNDSMDEVEKAVESLPKYISEEELDETVRQVALKIGVQKEQVLACINRRYKQFGKFYGERRPTVTFICDWILKTRFANGYKINDEIDAARFISYMDEMFGKENSQITPRALDVKIYSVGILCDRGKYIHPSYVTINQEILDEINQYIIDSPKNAITYSELYNAFREKLVGTQISNQYFLQGVIKQYKLRDKNNDAYYLHRDYVTKDNTISPTNELDTFVKERGIVHKTEIYAEFPALNDISIVQVVARCQDVFKIDSGNYIHSSQFHILENDYPLIRDYLITETKELPANIRKVYDDCSVLFPEFMDRNEIHNRDILFAVLNYMFGKEFKFNRPYIANSDDIELTNRGVILGILNSFDEIAIDELAEILDERGIHYNSLYNLLQIITPEYMRVDENVLMKRELTGIDDDVEDEALSILNESLESSGYLPSSKVSDFIWYPTIDISWTPYLLECIVLCNDKIDYIQYPFSRSKRSLLVYVGKQYSKCDYQSFILQIIGSEYEKGSFNRKADMREWLIEEGLIDVKLPAFLEGSQYYYIDEDGILKRRLEGNNV